MGVGELVENRSDQFIAIDCYKDINDDTLVSLISHVNWSAGWNLLTKLNCSNSTREHDAVPRQSSMYIPTKVIRYGISAFV